jgi:hypothetical protein
VEHQIQRSTWSYANDTREDPDSGADKRKYLHA